MAKKYRIIFRGWLDTSPPTTVELANFEYLNMLRVATIAKDIWGLPEILIEEVVDE